MKKKVVCLGIKKLTLNNPWSKKTIKTKKNSVILTEES